MKASLENRWEALRTNFWFVPAFMVAGAVALFAGLLTLDAAVATAGAWVHFGTVEGIRVLLGVLIGSLATALSVVFSITIVALTLAASQLGPRLLRTFMRDRANQVTLGLFVSTFVYCLLTLVSIGKAEQRPETPDITILGGLLLTLASLAVLVYFIHHVAEALQAPNVILAVSRELEWVIDREFPETLKPSDREKEPPPTTDLPQKAGDIAATEDEYIQAIDVAGLVDVAAERDLVIRVTHRPGDFVVRGEPLAVVYGAETLEGDVERMIRRMMRTAFILGVRRTSVQDVEYVLTQLVEMAVRALSPGINDPFTAMTCVEKLEAALCHLAGRRMPPVQRCDEEGRLRLILDQTTFAGICNSAFDQVRQHARTDAAVMIRMLEALHVIARYVRTDEQRQAVWRQAAMIHRAGQDLPEPLDRKDAEERFQAIEKALQPDPKLPKD